MAQDICHSDGDSVSHVQPVDSIAHVTPREGTTMTLSPMNNVFQCLCEKPFKTNGGFPLVKSIPFGKKLFNLHSRTRVLTNLSLFFLVSISTPYAC
ncbi:unnamed protein product [Absidia cylindrospora]